MIQSSKTDANTQTRTYPVVDPCTLGRPTHLLHRFTARLREDLSEQFESSLNRRYRANFDVREVFMYPMEQAVFPGRWMKYVSSSGRIDCALDRGIVLCALAHRYGSPGAGIPSSTDIPETETEKRLAAVLSLQFVNTLAACVSSLFAGNDSEHAQRQEFGTIAASAPEPGTWMVEVAIDELTHGVSGCVCFTLCDAWMDRLLRSLSRFRDKPNENRAQAPISQLELKLVAQLLEMDLPLGDLVDIRVGDIIPVRLDNADVLIGNSRLFTATVAEHKGKLCLTSFEDAD
jgi:flagellar motor switch protein FliM